MSKILIIEDDPILLESLSDFLQEEGMEVVLAENGKKGVEVAVRELPDLILCDIFMPKMNGYEAFEKLKSDVTTSLIPFIFLTAKAEREDILYGMTLGADDYITKPIDFDELLARITKRMEKTRETIRRSEIKYHAVFEQAHDAILLIRMADLCIVDANQAACDMLEHSREEILEVPGRRFIQDVDLREVVDREDARSWDIQAFHDIETAWRRKDDKQIQVLVSGKMVSMFAENYLFLMAQDITERK
ncbi:MAG: response regulator, partial [Bacteroidia bacterium]|nr:response regulator [Bacteroidia bacterium]